MRGRSTAEKGHDIERRIRICYGFRRGADRIKRRSNNWGVEPRISMASTIKKEEPGPLAGRRFSLRSTTPCSVCVQVFLLILIMRAMVPFLVSWAPVLQRAFGFPGSPHKRSSIDDFAANEEPVALAGLLCNIGSNGCEARGVPSGVVLASPSRSDPDCKFTRSRGVCSI